MDIIGIVGLVTGVSGMVLGILNYRRDYLEALNQYFSQSRNPLITEGKAIIYNSNPQEIEKMLEDFPQNVPDSIVEVINFYHHWGLMLKHRQIPLWLFYDRRAGLTASGNAVVRTYEKIKPIIELYKDKNKTYAQYYKILYEKLYKHYNDVNTEAR